MDSVRHFEQIENMGSMPDYRQKISDAYYQPVVKGVVDNMAKTESQFLPTIYDAFRGGTGAADMSLASKMSNMGRKLGRLTSRVNAGSNILNFYGNQVNDLANRAGQDYQQNMQRQMFLAQMAQQREEAERNRQAQLRSAGMAAGAQRFDIGKLIEQLTGGGEMAQQGQGAVDVQVTSPEALNAVREVQGMPRVSEEYFRETYQPRNIDRFGNINSIPQRLGNLFANMIDGGSRNIMSDDLYTYVPEGTTFEGDFFRYDSLRP